MENFNQESFNKKVGVVAENNQHWVATIGLVAGEFFFYFLRNALFLGSITFFIFIFAIIQIYFQDNYGSEISPLGQIGRIIIELDKIPIITNYIGLEALDRHYNWEDTERMFVRLAFYFTVFTEILKYIKRLIFKKERKVENYHMKKRLLFVVSSMAIIYVASTILIFNSKGNVGGLFGIIFMIFIYLIHVGVTMSYVVFDFIAIKFRETMKYKYKSALHGKIN